MGWISIFRLPMSGLVAQAMQASGECGLCAAGPVAGVEEGEGEREKMKRQRGTPGRIGHMDGQRTANAVAGAPWMLLPVTQLQPHSCRQSAAQACSRSLVPPSSQSAHLPIQSLSPPEHLPPSAQASPAARDALRAPPHAPRAHPSSPDPPPTARPRRPGAHDRPPNLSGGRLSRIKSSPRPPPARLAAAGVHTARPACLIRRSSLFRGISSADLAFSSPACALSRPWARPRPLCSVPRSSAPDRAARECQSKSQSQRRARSPCRALREIPHRAPPVGNHLSSSAHLVVPHFRAHAAPIRQPRVRCRRRDPQRDKGMPSRAHTASHLPLRRVLAAGPPAAADVIPRASLCTP